MKLDNFDFNPKEDKELGISDYVIDAFAAPVRGLEGMAHGVYNLGDFLSFDLLPDWDEQRFFGRSQTVPGSLIEGLTQFAVPFGIIGKGISAAGKAARAGQITGVTGKAAKALTKGKKPGKFTDLNLKGYLGAEMASDFVAFDGQEERLANLIQQFPDLQNPITEYLAADPDDNELVGRAKNVLEGALIGLGVGAVAKSVMAGLNAIKTKNVEIGKGANREDAVTSAMMKWEDETKDLRVADLPDFKFIDDEARLLREIEEDKVAVANEERDLKSILDKEKAGETIDDWQKGLREDRLDKFKTDLKNNEEALDKLKARKSFEKQPELQEKLEEFDVGIEELDEVIATRPPPYQTYEDARMLDRIPRGAEDIIKRLRQPNVLKDADPSDVKDIEKFIDVIGTRLFDDVAQPMITNKIPAAGRYEFGSNLLKIRSEVVKEGRLKRIMVHELWHSLSRYLPEKDLTKITKEFQRERNKYIQSFGIEIKDLEVEFDPNTVNRKDIPKELDRFLRGKRGDFNNANYRYKDIDEYFAEEMSDAWFKKEATGKLAPSGSPKRIAQEFAIFFKDLFESLKAKLGIDQRQKIFNDFLKQRNVKVQRQSSLRPGEFSFTEMPDFKPREVPQELQESSVKPISLETFKNDKGETKMMESVDVSGLTANKGKVDAFIAEGNSTTLNGIVKEIKDSDDPNISYYKALAELIDKNATSQGLGDVPVILVNDLGGKGMYNPKLNAMFLNVPSGNFNDPLNRGFTLSTSLHEIIHSLTVPHISKNLGDIENIAGSPGSFYARNKDIFPEYGSPEDFFKKGQKSRSDVLAYFSDIEADDAGKIARHEEARVDMANDPNISDEIKQVGDAYFEFILQKVKQKAVDKDLTFNELREGNAYFKNPPLAGKENYHIEEIRGIYAGATIEEFISGLTNPKFITMLSEMKASASYKNKGTLLEQIKDAIRKLFGVEKGTNEATLLEQTLTAVEGVGVKPAENNVFNSLRQLADDPTLFRGQTSKKETLEESIAEAFPQFEIEGKSYYPELEMGSIVIQDPNNYGTKTKIYSFKIKTDKAGEVTAHSTVDARIKQILSSGVIDISSFRNRDKYINVDTSEMAGKGGVNRGTDTGSKMYQTILQYAFNKNNLYVPSSIVSDINQTRLIGAMLSSALKNNSTAHFIPEGNFIEWKRLPDDYVWGRDFEKDIEYLAEFEASIVNDVFRLNKFSYDFSSDKIIKKGEEFPRTDDVELSDEDLLREITDVDPTFKRGIGVRTLKRAILNEELRKGKTPSTAVEGTRLESIFADPFLKPSDVVDDIIKDTDAPTFRVGGKQSLTGIAKTMGKLPEGMYPQELASLAEQGAEKLLKDSTKMAKMSQEMLDEGVVNELADAMGANGKMLNSLIQQASKDKTTLFRITARMKSLESMLAANGKEILNVAEQYKNKKGKIGEDELETIEARLKTLVEQQLHIQASQSGLASGFGRGLKSRQMDVKIGIGPNEIANTKLRQEYLNKRGGMTVDEMVEGIMLAKSGQGDDLWNTLIQMNKVIRGAEGGKLMDMVEEYYKNSIMYGPRTLTVNATGGAMSSALKNFERYVGGWLSSSPDVKRAVVNSVSQGMHMKDLARFVLNAWKSGDHYIGDARSAFVETPGGSVGSITAKNVERLRGKDIESDAVKGFIDFMGNAIRIPNRFNTSVDQMYKFYEYRNRASANLGLKAFELGIRDPKKVAEYVEDSLSALITRSNRNFSTTHLIKEAEQFVQGPFATPAAREKAIADYVQQAQSEALETARRNKLVGEDSRDNDFMALEELARDWVDPNIKSADEIAFSEQLGPTMQKLQGFVSGVPLGFMVAPFIRTPTNILKFSFSRLLAPGEIAYNTAKYLKGGEYAKKIDALQEGKAPALEKTRKSLLEQINAVKADGSPDLIARAEAKGKLATGTLFNTALATTVYHFKDKINGGGPKDFRQRKVWMAAGNMPYSIKVGDTWMSYQRLDPIATIIGVYADMADLLEDGKMHSIDSTRFEQISSALTLTLTRNATNKSYLSGIDKFFSLVFDPESTSGAKYLGAAAGGFIPNIFNQGQSITGDQELKEARDFADVILKRIPGVAMDLKRNPLGEPVVQEYFEGISGVLNPLNPIMWGGEKNDAVLTELARVSHGFSAPSTKLDGLIDLTNFDGANDRSAYDRWLDLQSKIKINNLTLRQSLTKLINNKEYRSLDPQSFSGLISPRVAYLQRIIGRYRKAAKMQMLKEFPEVRQEQQKLKSASTREDVLELLQQTN